MRKSKPLAVERIYYHKWPVNYATPYARAEYWHLSEEGASDCKSQPEDKLASEGLQYITPSDGHTTTQLSWHYYGRKKPV
jgi:hypothetical protein